MIKRKLLLYNQKIGCFEFYVDIVSFINVKISGANTEVPFLTNIGTPQGDSLSPVLFIIYLEQALKNVRSTLDSPSNTTEADLPNEIVYADDIDFFGN